MSNELWIEAVDNARLGNETLFNKVVSFNFKQHFCTPILKLTKDKSIVEEIYILSITKFWERFILLGEELPNSNINGYIFQMIRNAFFEIKRKRNTIKASSIISIDSTEIFETYSSYVLENKNHEENSIQFDKNVLLKSVFEAMDQLDPICKEIIEKNVLESHRLKMLKEEMAFTGPYNSFVQKKKRCIEKLKKLLNTVISSNSTNLEIPI